jgi:hypothetical protein
MVYLAADDTPGSDSDCMGDSKGVDHTDSEVIAADEGCLRALFDGQS